MTTCQLACIIELSTKGGDKVNRLEQKEKEANIQETRSKTFKNYAIGISVIASTIKLLLSYLS